MPALHNGKIVRELIVVKEELFRIRAIGSSSRKPARRNFAQVLANDQSEIASGWWHHFLRLGLVPAKAHLVDHIGRNDLPLFDGNDLFLV